MIQQFVHPSSLVNIDDNRLKRNLDGLAPKTVLHQNTSQRDESQNSRGYFPVPVQFEIGKETVSGTIENFEATDGGYIHYPKLPQPDVWA